MSMTRGRYTTFAFLVLVLVLVPVTVGALETVEHTPQQDGTRMLRFEFDNDAPLGSDNAFTAGWSLQYHSAASDTWGNTSGTRKRKGPATWFSSWVPGLQDDGVGGRMVRQGFGLSQVIQTPEDIQNPDPQPDDIPWVGTIWESNGKGVKSALDSCEPI